VHEFGTPEYDQYISPEKRQAGSRAVIVIDVHKVSTVCLTPCHSATHIITHFYKSCGYAVPFYEFKGHRTQLLEYMAKREDAPTPETSIYAYWSGKNAKSIDGLPGLLFAPDAKGPFTRCPIESLNVKAKAVPSRRSSWSAGLADGKVLAGFSAGVLAAAMYVRFTK
jgi:hypothetical protein